MNINKKFSLTILLSIFSISLLSGCVKVVSTENSTIQVKIVDAYYKSPYTTFMYVGKTLFPQSHPAEYKIAVEYDNIRYWFDDKDVYEKYSDRIGEYTNGTLEIRKYDDGTRKYRIIGLE